MVTEHDFNFNFADEQGNGLLVLHGLMGIPDLLILDEGKGWALIKEVDMVDVAVDTEGLAQQLLAARDR